MSSKFNRKGDSDVCAYGYFRNQHWHHNWKYRQFRKVRLANSKLQLSLKSQDKLENIRALINMHKSECLMGLMLDKLFNSESDDLDLINQSMEATANLELHRLEKGLGWLSTFAAIAPLIGFLGTVIGMVNVFMKIQLQPVKAEWIFLCWQEEFGLPY